MSAPVDVLAVLDDHIRVHGRNQYPNHARELLDVRTAVAELIEADKKFDASRIEFNSVTESCPYGLRKEIERDMLEARKRRASALARVGGDA